VLVIGGGGRESALAWACRRHGHDVTVQAELPQELSPAHVDLVIVGPEAALAAGVADRCAAAGVPCFGPTAELARLESSKGFARELAQHLHIPSPRFVRTSDVDTALAWWRDERIPVVVKADGLAAGKGVIVPDGDADTEAAIRAMIAGGPIVLEERLTGPECSLIAVCDGTVARPLPLSQDHKRIGEGDAGANTGGMGAFAPVSVGVSATELNARFVQPVIDHLAAAGTPYVGVLYAGLMITADGPRLLEWNCRFGDPEAQALLPLLDCDVAELALACCHGRLAGFDLFVSPRCTCTVVAAAPGYPAEPVLGAPVTGVQPDPRPDRAVTFEAGMRDGRVSGGRVLSVTGIGDTLAQARDAAYERMSTIHFDGMQVRGDIAWRAIGASLPSYAAAGVDISEGNRAVANMKAAVESTHGPAVLRGVGSFGGSFSAAALKDMDDPVLVASTDGVGTKVELAARLGRYRGVGADIVNHCINDVFVQGARPLFFLDYVASSKLDADQVAEVVTGMAEACATAGCALLGGETAEMPGVYAPGAFDIAGTLVGLVERRDLLPRTDLVDGDVLVGVASNGPHTNGYSLLRKLFDWLPMDCTPPGFTTTLGDALLVPHRNYLPVLDKVVRSGHVKALAHITGGGLVENIQRVVPRHLDTHVTLGSWPLSPLWQLVGDAAAALSDTELHRTVNMGIGMVVVCSAADREQVQALIDEPTWAIGALRAGSGRVILTRRD
jgi:phosphoribosylamine--glycine ligase/phosphoribosylaminoimidazole synthetase